MRTLVTGSSGHLGQALVRTLRAAGESVVGVDVKAGEATDVVASVSDRDAMAALVADADAILHTATLHKPHIVTHSRQQFVDTNVSGTLALLDAAVEHGCERFVFVSTTSVFGHAMRPGSDVPSAWVHEDLVPVPRNIYGVTKSCAEQLCELAHGRDGLPVLVLRTSRFFPEIDDDEARRAEMEDANLKTVEFLNRRVSIEDVVSACLLAREHAPAIGFDRFIITGDSPFDASDLAELRSAAPAVLERRLPGTLERLRALGWRMSDGLDRVYSNARARERLGWEPRHDFLDALRRVEETGDWRTPLAVAIGRKGYHDEVFTDGPYPVE